MNLDGLLITRTYEGWLMGAPPPEKAIEAARERASKAFGDNAPILVKDPPIRERALGKDRIHKMIPPWRFIAYLSQEPIQPAGIFDGSHLIVIWFADACDYDVTPQLANVDWNTHAKNFGL
jgi:hypothetical protein